MKKNISLLAFLFLGISLFAQSKSLNSTIEKVTVFFSGAQISRTVTTPLSMGKSELVFKGLTANLDTRSVQVRGEGDFTVLSVTPRTNFLESAAKRDTIKDLEEQLDVLKDRLALENNQLVVLQQEEMFLQRNQVQILGIANISMKLEDLKQVADYQRDRMAQILNKRFEIQKDVTKLNVDFARIRLQLSEMDAKKNTITSEIVVVVHASSATSGKFFVSYVVPNASWTPTYDMRVKDISTPLSMQLKADVRQATGEDWKEVKLTLSSGNPMESGVKPELQAWRLGFFHPITVPSSYNNGGGYEQVLSNFRRNPAITQVSGIVTTNTGEFLPGVAVVLKGTTMGVLTDINGKFSLTLTPSSNVLVISSVGFTSKEMAITSSNFNIVLQENSNTLSEVVVVGSRGRKRKDVSRSVLADKITDSKNDAEAPETEEVIRTTTVNYEIAQAYSIQTDNKAQTVEIRDLEIPATYQYFVAPKLDKDAFLTAQIIDWEQYNLLSGAANLFFEGTFMGKTVLNTLITDDTLNISLGRDKSVVVTRTKLKDFTKTKFLSDKRTDSRAFETTVRNKRGQPLSIIVEDQIPISSTKELEIETDTGNATVDAPTGKLTWKLDVPSGKDKKVKFSYTAKYPKSQRIILE
jgi:Domain of unknown function (DUF4139)/N-terminal domain of unknown function (DUF4140)